MSNTLAERRVLRWENVRGPRRSIALVIATALGSGLSPVAPGTFGTLVGIPIAYFTQGWAWSWRLVLWAAIFAAGTWAASAFDAMMGTKDNQHIVIDEVVGYGITAWTAGTHPIAIVAAFILFRLYDILKPPPVKQLDRWSHRKGSGPASLGSGFGVMADDALAGLLGLITMLILQRFGVIPR
jgi:phosphatidylglycerophosphatase A